MCRYCCHRFWCRVKTVPLPTASFNYFKYSHTRALLHKKILMDFFWFECIVNSVEIKWIVTLDVCCRSRICFWIQKLKCQQKNKRKSTFHNYSTVMFVSFVNNPMNFQPIWAIKIRKEGSSNKITDLFRIFFESVYSKPSSFAVKKFIENSQQKGKIPNICSIIPPAKRWKIST